MDGKEKKYDYDAVIAFTNTGGPLDSALSDIQKSTKELRELMQECEELFHGKGQTSSVYLAYKAMYEKIGNIGVANGSIWNVCNNSKELINLMHANALSDKELDEM